MIGNASNSAGVTAWLRDARLARLTAVGAIAVSAALTTYLARPSRRRDPARQRRRSLIAYLRDHLGGSDVAMRIVDRLATTHADTEDGLLFRRLSKELEEDRAVVRSLLVQLGASARSLKRPAGYVSGVLLSLSAGGNPGDLSLLRTLEALSIGVQGKRCMWRALQRLGSAPPMGGTNFLELEAKAVRQWEAIEERRGALAVTTFSTFGSGTRAT